MRPAADDGIRDEWFPVAAVADVAPGAWSAFDLLGERLLLLRDLEGAVSVVHDTCPHRGAQLSLGSFDGERLTCPYHGWEFAPSGSCLRQPAQPGRTPPAAVGLAPVAVAEAYGLWWACLGSSPRRLPRYEAYDDHPGRSVMLGPERLASSGPRIVENFLDMAHFPFVHRDYLGAPPHTEVTPYPVEVVDGDVVVRDAWFTQPYAGPGAEGGEQVLYGYTVPGPYSATLIKLPGAARGDDRGIFSILLAVSPEDELHCRAWMVTTVHDPELDLDEFDSFGRLIFGQDIPIVESQRPRRLPVNPREEVHQRADRVSLVYRSYLQDRGVRYGTTANGGPEP